MARILAEINLKYLDRDGYRIGSDAENGGLTIPSFDKGERVKKKIPFPMPEAVGAQVRDIFAIG